MGAEKKVEGRVKDIARRRGEKTLKT